MPQLSTSIDASAFEALPETINPRELYVEQDGKHVLTGIAGMKTQQDVDTVKGYLQTERDEHKETKKKLRAFDGLEADDVQTKLSRLAELEVMAKGNNEEFESKLEELTEARVNTRVAPVERQLKAAQDALKEQEEELLTLRAEKTQRVILDSVRLAAGDAKLPAEAMADAELLAEAIFEIEDTTGKPITKENKLGFTQGVEADVFFTELKEKRPHWWPESRGGNAPGSGGGGGFPNNPWSAKHWNVTEQGRVFKEHGKEKAEQMARAAGTTFGGPKPEK